jgi:fumarate hydratase subunit beta
MTEPIRITPPFSNADVEQLKAGDRVLISGIIYTGRDAAHKRMVEAIANGKPLPFELEGQVIYFVGPAPAKPGQVIGSAGPTTSYRMDAYSPILIEHGLKGMIGKGFRSPAVVEAMQKHKAVYFSSTGGAAALIAKQIKEVEIIAYEDLGTEAVRRMRVENFPAIVVNDVHGNDLFKQGRDLYGTYKPTSVGL